MKIIRQLSFPNVFVPSYRGLPKVVGNLVNVILVCTIFATGNVLAQDASKQHPTAVHVTVGKVSEVVFPEKVAKIIKGGAPDSVLVEVLDQSVYLMPKSDTPADIFVTGVSGRSYPLNLSIAPQHDIRVEIGGSSVLSYSVESANNSAMDVMKDILAGHEPAGATALKGDHGGVLFKDGQIQLSVRSGYDLSTLTVYILEAHNLTDNSVIIPLEQFSFPRLLAAASDRDMIAPKGQEGDRTAVYLVVGK